MENARSLLAEHGRTCTTSVEDLKQWFLAETPFDKDFGLNQVVKSPLLVVHELVEIEEVMRMGLTLSKNVIVDNLGKVDDAHLKAVKVEIDIALSKRNRRHLRDRMEDLRSWIKDSSVSPRNRSEYARLLRRVAGSLSSDDWPTPRHRARHPE